MSKNTLFRLFLLTAPTFACDHHDGAPEPEPQPEIGRDPDAREPRGGGVVAGSCETDEGRPLCGGPGVGSCFCDDACEDYGDCCDDKSDVCDEFGEVCGNGEDDNGDGFTDCDDPQCAATEECSGGSSWPEEPGDEFGEICFNGEDDNGDGLADCADPLCADDPDCHDGVVEDSCVGVCGGQAPAGCWCDDVCANEGDCCSDYADACEQPLGEWCSNGEDDNADDLIDCDDPQCADDPSCTDDAAPPSCDGFCGEQAPTGCWCDDGCAEYGDCCPDQAELCSSEFSEFCGNGEDDNGDGLVDCEDPDCAAEC